MLRAQTRPFTWAEALAAFDSPGAERVMRACWETTGAAAGVVVPVRGRYIERAQIYAKRLGVVAA